MLFLTLTGKGTTTLIKTYYLPICSCLGIRLVYPLVSRRAVGVAHENLLAPIIAPTAGNESPNPGIQLSRLIDILV